MRNPFRPRPHGLAPAVHLATRRAFVAEEAARFPGATDGRRVDDDPAVVIPDAGLTAEEVVRNGAANVAAFGAYVDDRIGVATVDDGPVAAHVAALMAEARANRDRYAAQARASFAAAWIEDGAALGAGQDLAMFDTDDAVTHALDIATAYLEDREHGARRAMLVLAGLCGWTAADIAEAIA